jgi:formylglycine-generating enzyme
MASDVASAPPHPGMVWVPGGTFRMGSDDHYPEERPAHDATVAGLWVDATPVTVAAFAAFVAATGHVTVSERSPDPALYPGAPPEALVPASIVFTPPPGPVPLDGIERWWSLVPDADWRHPEGPGTSVDGREDHPVTHVAYEDAAAYAEWAGKALPTEAEWERAARGGLDDVEFAWGDELVPDGVHMANTFQGTFPWANTVADGWERTSPVGAYPPNGYGLLDAIGNVWEWTTTWYAAEHDPGRSCCGGSAARAASVDPAAGIERRVTKGGSHLCAPDYCRRYRPAARMGQTVDTATSHVGFRCVVRP